MGEEDETAGLGEGEGARGKRRVLQRERGNSLIREDGNGFPNLIEVVIAAFNMISFFLFFEFCFCFSLFSKTHFIIINELVLVYYTTLLLKKKEIQRIYYFLI